MLVSGLGTTLIRLASVSAATFLGNKKSGPNSCKGSPTKRVTSLKGCSGDTWNSNSRVFTKCLLFS